MTLYHGTQVGNIEELKPSISLEFESFVYATQDISYALVRAGKQLDEIREEYYGEDERFELAECYPDAFKHQFDCSGYIYVLNSDDFEYNPETTEWRSRTAVKPISVMHIDNIWNEMIKRNDEYKFIYDRDEEYWKTVRGGKEGYLKRKLQAKQRMLNLRKELLGDDSLEERLESAAEKYEDDAIKILHEMGEIEAKDYREFWEKFDKAFEDYMSRLRS